MTEIPAPTAKTLKPCTCSTFEVGDFEPNKDGAEFRTECDRQTNRLFAQGHDAKLISFLVKGEIDGYTIRNNGGVTFSGAVAAAKSISQPLADKAATMLAKAKERADAKAAREANKKQAANQEQAPAEGKPAAEAKPAPRRRGRAKTTA